MTGLCDKFAHPKRGPQICHPEPRVPPAPQNCHAKDLCIPPTPPAMLGTTNAVTAKSTAVILAVCLSGTAQLHSSFAQRARQDDCGGVIVTLLPTCLDAARGNSYFRGFGSTLLLTARKSWRSVLLLL